MHSRLAFRRITEIVGFTADGAAYCVACWDTPADPEDQPVFLSDADDMICDWCFQPLDA